MSKLTFKSRLIKGCDYTAFDISRFAIPLAADEKRLEQDVRAFRRRFAKQMQVDNVCILGIVTLSCISDDPKFNKERLTLRVGLNLFSKEFEAQLIGKRVGEEFEIEADGSAVKVKILGIVGEVLPEVNDELAARCGIKEIACAEDIYTYCRYKQYDRILEDAADDAFAYLAGKIIEESQFELDAQEKSAADEMMMKVFDKNSALQGRTLDELTDKDFIEIFGCDKSMLLDSFKDTGSSTLKAAVLGQEMMKEEDALITERDYWEYIDKVAAAKERSKEETAAENPRIEYMLNTYSEHYMDAVEAYVYRKLKEIGECMHRSAQG